MNSLQKSAKNSTSNSRFSEPTRSILPYKQKNSNRNTMIFGAFELI